MNSPLIVLAPPRSFSSVVTHMLGQHPDMYSLPELHLFTGDTVADIFGYFDSEGQRSDRRADGIRRAIAEVFLGKQNPATVHIATKWLRTHAEDSTSSVLERIMKKVAPRTIVEKSITSVWNEENLARAIHSFPDAKLLHLTRHPRSHGKSMFELITDRNWEISRGIYDYSTTPPTLDPQLLWLRVHTRIIEALKTVPDERKIQVSGESVLRNPDETLANIAEWLGLRTDSEAIEAMKHPENSPFATVGPDNAPMGSDQKFLESPKFDPSRFKEVKIEGKLPWRDDIPGFRPDVIELAERFGYQ